VRVFHDRHHRGEVPDVDLSTNRSDPHQRSGLCSAPLSSDGVPPVPISIPPLRFDPPRMGSARSKGCSPLRPHIDPLRIAYP
jgi:hypothetical protein